MQDTLHHFETITEAKAFAFAGNATLTLESLKSGAHYTYKVKQAKDQQTGEPKPGIYFVNLLSNGNANDDNNFTYLGMINEVLGTGDSRNRFQFRLTRASRAGMESPSVKAFRFFVALTENHPALVVRHEGKCGRCGRTLTVPESIDRGIGPECATKM
jgi:hypothetical protein